jgi:hypothetical protein
VCSASRLSSTCVCGTYRGRARSGASWNVCELTSRKVCMKRAREEDVDREVVFVVRDERFTVLRSKLQVQPLRVLRVA